MVSFWSDVQFCVCYLNPFLISFLAVFAGGKRQVALCNAQLPVLSYLKKASMPVLIDVTLWIFYYLFWHYCKLDIETHALGFFLDSSLVSLVGIIYLSERDAQLKSSYHRVVFRLFVGICLVGYFYFYIAPQYLDTLILILVYRMLFLMAGGPYLLLYLLNFPNTFKHSKTLDMTAFLLVILATCLYISRCCFSTQPRTFSLLFGLIKSPIPASPPFLLRVLCVITSYSPETLFYYWCLLSSIFSLKFRLSKRNEDGLDYRQTLSPAQLVYYDHELSKNYQSEHVFGRVKVTIYLRRLAIFLILLLTVLADEYEIAHGIMLLVQLVWGIVFFLRQLSRFYPDMDSKEAVLKQKDKELQFIVQRHLRECIVRLIVKNREAGKLGIDETEYILTILEYNGEYMKEALHVIDNCTSRLGIIRFCYPGRPKKFSLADFKADVNDAMSNLPNFPKHRIPPVRLLRQCARQGFTITESGTYGDAMKSPSFWETA